MRIGYARVSTREQNTDGQLDALHAAGCERVYVDKASGKLARRPEWDRCREQLRRGDALVVTKLDRMGRSVRHLIDVVGELDRQGVELVVLAQGIDTTSPGGRLLFHVLAAMAEFVGDLISENTHEGLAAARARGRWAALGDDRGQAGGGAADARGRQHDHGDRGHDRGRAGDAVPEPAATILSCHGQNC